MEHQHDTSKDLLVCLHCEKQKNTKCEYRRKYIADHTRSKHPGKTPQYRLSSHKAISELFAGLSKKRSAATQQQEGQELQEPHTSSNTLTLSDETNGNIPPEDHSVIPVAKKQKTLETAATSDLEEDPPLSTQINSNVVSPIEQRKYICCT